MAKHMTKNKDFIKNEEKQSKIEKEQRKREGHKGSIFILIFRIISLIIIAICICKLVFWYIENKKNNDILNDIISEQKTEEIVVGDEKIKVLRHNFDELLAKNGDTVGWLIVKGTKINYPIVHCKDNDFYLNHSFDKSYNSAGWIFANYINKFDGTDKNISIFGHNRRDGSMFCTLKDTIKKDWYTNPDNYIITFDTPSKLETYKVFSNYQIRSESYYLTNSFKDEQEYKTFLDTITSRSVYNYGIKPNVNDKIITLSTCANDNTYRVVLHAVKVE